MPNYSFAVELVTTIQVKAANFEDARRMVSDALNNAETNFGAFPNGDPILAEVSVEWIDNDPESCLVEDEEPN